MPTVQHSALTTGELHEPKGAASATEGQAYIADGAGSGTWTDVYQYADIGIYESDAVSVGSIGTTPQTFPFSQDGQEGGGITADSANNRITVTDAGKYFVSFAISFSTTAVGDAGLYKFKIVNNGTVTEHMCARQMSGSSDTGSASCQSIISVVAGGHLTVQVESDEAGDTDDIDVVAADLVVFKVG